MPVAGSQSTGNGTMLREIATQSIGLGMRAS